jgi:lysophospholipase L1-like esterase
MAQLIALAALMLVPLPKAAGKAREVVLTARRALLNTGGNEEFREEAVEGYYEGLLSGDQAAVNAGGAQDPGMQGMEELWGGGTRLNERLHDFLLYRPLPNIDWVDTKNHRHHVTNSLGFQDRDYPFDRAPHTRRIVIVGDSMTRALGVEPGQGYEPLLEEYLNDHETTPEIRSFEVINLGVSGYRMTQIFDVAFQVAPRYKPDVYVVGLTWLTVGRRWGLHLSQLVEQGIDPRYDFLRQVIHDAGLKRGDSPVTSRAKLARFMLPTLRWGLTELRRRAEAEGAHVVVLLLPHINEAEPLVHMFNPVEAMLREERIPYVSALSALADKDLKALDCGDGIHPNAEGHRLILQALLRDMRSEPEAEALLLGRDPTSGRAAQGP